MKEGSISERSPSSNERLRKPDIRVLALLGLATLGYIVFGLLTPVEGLLFRLSDDSFYYFKVAENIVNGAGPTFDGINPTNGFHPLWMLVILPVFTAVPSDPALALRAIHVLIATLAGLGLWMAYRMMLEYGSRLAAITVAALFLSPFLLNSLLNGLESSLLLFLAFLSVWTLKRFDLASTRLGLGHDVFFGVLLAAVFLARLDSAFMILSILGLIYVRWLSGVDSPRAPIRLLRKLLILGGIGALFIIPYFVWNLSSFGHIVPISGALKSTFPEISFNPRRLLGFHALFGLGQILVTLILLLPLILRRQSSQGRGDRRRVPLAASPEGILVALWFGNALHFANAMLFMNWGAHWWHYASYLPLTLAVAARAGDRILTAVARPRWWAVTAGLLLLAFSLATLGIDASRRGDQHREWYEAAVWTDRELPADAVVGMTDCGIFGYFSNRPTVNLDGVINGYAYQRAIRDGRLSEFLRDCSVSHIAAHGTRYQEGVVRLWLPARLYGGPAAFILATPEAEVFRSEAHENVHGDPVRFFIWVERKIRVLEAGEARRESLN